MIKPVFKKKLINSLVSFFSIILFTVFSFYIFSIFLAKDILNPVLPGDIIKVSKEAKKLHESLLIADMHADSLLYHDDLTKQSNSGHLDFIRLQEGNVAIQVLAAVTKFPLGANIDSSNAGTDIVGTMAFFSLWPPTTYRDLTMRAIYQAQKMKSYSDSSDGKIIIIKNKSDLKDFLEMKKQDKDIIGVLLCVEGGHALKGDAENLEVLFSSGFRIMSLTHFFDNELGGSMHGEKKQGLSSFGRDIISSMQDMGMIIDLAHASGEMIDDVLDIASVPVIVSHTGVKAIYDNNRNLSDDQIETIAGKGGLIGIGFWDTAMGKCDVTTIARSIRHVCDLVGAEHAGLGSDFDGAVKAPIDASQLSQITQALINEGLTDSDISLVMGTNFIRFLEKNLPD